MWRGTLPEHMTARRKLLPCHMGPSWCNLLITSKELIGGSHAGLCQASLEPELVDPALSCSQHVMEAIYMSTCRCRKAQHQPQRGTPADHRCGAACRR